jgi:hypothetical protein
LYLKALRQIRCGNFWQSDLNWRSRTTKQPLQQLSSCPHSAAFAELAGVEYFLCICLEYPANMSRHPRVAMILVIVAVFWCFQSAPSPACTFHRRSEIAEVSNGDIVFRGKLISHAISRSPRVSGALRTLDIGTMTFVVAETLRGPTKSEWTIKLIDAGMGLADEWKDGDAVIVAANRESSELAPLSWIMRRKPCSDLPIFLDTEENSSLARRALLSSR